ncbi:shikimate dehydrogenase [Bacillus sp. FJAT-45350]|uniref:shikimate dehydrogenase n=1 Tax=Bacillus sp. FJAT-45350 TaxID=2011014 RepID=UPI000BB7A3ED|nr:shikimate dehydrogenase [Bacillus sp. FJAT-45350]
MGKLFGLLGHPVGHSMSPAMHNDAFASLELSHFYHAFDVPEENLKTAVEGLKALGVSGFNVTIPHKVAIMELLDEVDQEAKIIGAVNTVVNEDGRFVGYNTDGQGYLTSLLEVTGDSLRSKSVLVIGAGGAARAIATVISNYGVKSLTICNRTIDKAKWIADNCFSNTKMDAMTLVESEKLINRYDVIINTTSVGMSPNIDEVPISVESVKKGTVVSDLIYNPLKTKFLEQAESKGAIIVNGVGMFVGQGAHAFEKWTGLSPNKEQMKKIVEEQLGG